MEEPQMELLVQIVGNLGIVGVLVWYLWHNTTKTIPEIVDKHAKTIDAITTKHETTITGMTTRHENNLKEERVARKEELESFKAWARTDIACRYNSMSQKDRQQ